MALAELISREVNDEMERRESTGSLSPLPPVEFGHRRRGAVRRGHVYEVNDFA